MYDPGRLYAAGPQVRRLAGRRHDSPIATKRSSAATAGVGVQERNARRATEHSARRVGVRVGDPKTASSHASRRAPHPTTSPHLAPKHERAVSMHSPDHGLRPPVIL